MSWRQTAIGLITTRIGWINNRVNEVNMPIVTHQHITFNGIKDVVLAIGIIFTIALRMKAYTNKFVMYFLLSGNTNRMYKPLY